MTARVGLFGVAALLTLPMLLQASGASGAPAEVITVEASGPLDAPRLRAAIGRELAVTPVAPEDPRAERASGNLTVVVRPADRTLTVSFRRRDGGEAGGRDRPPVTRSVPLPATSAQTMSSAVFLAGNLARDEAGDVLDAIAVNESKVPPARTENGTAPPTSRQVDGLATLSGEVSAYERGARRYRETLTDIVRLHYESKKRAILSGLDREVAVERSELTKARTTAIARLEAFIAAHEDRREGPEVPDAMYRLAALYEERAAESSDEALAAQGHRHAIRLYKRILREHPSYKEIAGVYYFLGHALNDAGRLPESQQVWRSLVCHNHFAYPAAVDPRDPERDIVLPMPQDGAAPAPRETYVEVYPADCAPVAAAGARSKYVAEIWWQIGNWEFDQLDLAAGPWSYDRAASAYRHALAASATEPAIHGVALYKYAWTLFKQQRHELATRTFVELLGFTDEEERRTGDRGADFRSEATTYIAGALTTVDFKGPPASSPWRPPADEDLGARRGEDKLRVALDRVRDPGLIPQDKPWTIDIYRALATELRDLGVFGDAAEVYETMLRRWPLDPSAPETQSAAAETYDQMAALEPRAAGAAGAAVRALEARTRLAAYVGSTPWVDANKDHPTAIQTAERLAERGLRQAAAQHTNQARAAVDAANSSAGRTTAELIERAVAEYRLAASAWSAWVSQHAEDAPEAYEARYWSADAHHHAARLAAWLHEQAPTVRPEPSAAEIDAAIAAAVLVRDSKEDDRYLDNAAFFLVDLSDLSRELAYARHEVARRDDVSFDGADPRTRNVVRQPIPAVVAASMDARDAYVARVPPARDPMKRALGYRDWVADTLFLYGEWELARPRYEAIWKEQCGVDEHGFKAWERLLTMATKQRDEARALALLDAVDAKKGGRSCDAAGERKYADPVRMEAIYEQARRRLAEVCERSDASAAGSCANADDPRKKAAWREVAALYEQAAAVDPSRDEAAEGAMNAAFAYQHAGGGEGARALALYEKVIDEQGASSRASLEALRAEPTRLAARMRTVEAAYEALASAYAAVLDYQKTAATQERMAANPFVAEGKRREASRSALTLYASLGERDKVLSVGRALRELHPTPSDVVEADFKALSFDYARWDASGAAAPPDSAAVTALARFYDEYRGRPVAARRVIEAAHGVARMTRARGEADVRAWLTRTVAAWDDLNKREGDEAQKAPWVDLAAEAALSLVDQEIATKFDATVHAYPERSAQILGDPRGRFTGKFQLYAEQADRWDQRLEHDVIRKFHSAAAIVGAIARQGAVFDALRSGLYGVTRPKLFDPDQEALVAALRAHGQNAQADQLEDAAKDYWRTRKASELEGADEVMVRRYATALAYARAYNVKSPAVARASSRLAYYTRLLGDAKLGSYVTHAADPTDPSGKRKLVYTGGMYDKARLGLTAPTAPAAGQPRATSPIVP